MGKEKSKAFVFVFPTERFVRQENNKLAGMGDRLGNLIHEKYAAKGYEIIYAQYKDSSAPALGGLRPDKVIYTQSSFGSPISEPQGAKYRLLAENMGVDAYEVIVVGGFHYGKGMCVESMAGQISLINPNVTIDPQATDKLTQMIIKEKSGGLSK